MRTFNHVNYNPLTYAYSDFTGAQVQTRAVTANFGGGDVTGSVVEFIAVPEPDTLVLMGIGLALLGGHYRRRQQR